MLGEPVTEGKGFVAVVEGAPLGLSFALTLALSVPCEGDCLALEEELPVLEGLGVAEAHLLALGDLDPLEL